MCKSLYIRLLILVGLWCLLTPVLPVTEVRGQEDMRARTFNIHDGLPSNYISAIAQDSQGVIWVATWNGIASYDGYRFTTFRDGDGVLDSNRIFNIYPGEDGLIWILSYGKEPYVLDSRTGRYHKIGAMAPGIGKARTIMPRGDKVWILCDSVAVRITGKPDACDIDSVRARVHKVFVDSHDNEWLYTTEGLKKYGDSINIHDTFKWMAESDGTSYHVSRKGRIYKNDSPMVEARIPGVNNVTSLVVIARNLLACATDKGVYTYHTASRKLTDISGDLPLANADLHIDSSGRIWAILPGGDVAMAPSAAGGFAMIETRDPAGEHTIAGEGIFIEDRYGSVWLAAKDSPLCRYNDATGMLESQPVRSRLLNNSVMPKAEVVYVDRQGNLWLSTMQNLTVVNFCNRSLKEVTLIDNDPVRSVAFAPDSTVWLGTTGGTIGRYDSDGTSLGYVVNAPGGRYTTVREPAKFADRIYAMLTDSRGNIWVGTKGRGLYALSSDGLVSVYRHNPDDKWSIPDDNIYDIDEDDRGNIWGASYGGGVFLLRSADNEPGRRRFHSYLNGLAVTPDGKFLRARRVTHTPAGVIVVSCTEGLLTFSNTFSDPRDIEVYATVADATDASSLSSPHIMHTLSASDGTLYVAPLGESIQKVSAGSDLLRHQISFSPLTDGQTHPFLDEPSRGGNVISMVEGHDCRIFIVLETCVIAFTPTTGATISIGYNDFDRTLEFTEAKAAIDPHNGALWAPTARGAVMTDPDKDIASSFVPAIAVTATIDDSGQRRNCINPAEITLPAKENTVSLSVAALDYSNNELIQYAYRLDNADWTYIGNNNTISIGGLSYGRHTLTFKSTNGDGIWCDNARSVDIYVTPTFWESVPGHLCIALLVALPLAMALLLYRASSRHRRATAEHRRVRDFIVGFVSRRSGKAGDGDNGNPKDADSGLDEDATADNLMMTRLTEFIEEHISDENLRVEDMADAVGMGRTAFYSRLKALVDLTPADFVRRLRMQRACSLIKEGKHTFSEIAYMVGYSDPKYFSRCFKKETGMTPSEYRAAR